MSGFGTRSWTPKRCYDQRVPCGLELVIRLRLEAGLALYEPRLRSDNALEPSWWFCKLTRATSAADKRGKQKESGLRRKLVGFEVTERGIARDEYDVVVNDQRVGKVTSGSPAPYLKKNIGFAYLPAELANIGQEIKIDVRGRLIGAQVIKTPFYKRQK